MVSLNDNDGNGYCYYISDWPDKGIEKKIPF